MSDEAVLDVVETPVDDSAIDTGAETVETDSSTPEEVETVETDSSTPEEGTEQGKDGVVAKPTVSPKDQSITKVLKSLVDNNPDDPTAKSAAKLLREAYFGKQAFEKEFKSVGDARNAVSFINDLAGENGKGIEGAREAVANYRDLISRADESDQLVYAGDPQIVDNIIEDLKTQGVNMEDSFGKLGETWLEKMAEHAPDTYSRLVVTNLVEQLEGHDFPKGLNALSSALKTGDVAAAKDIVSQFIKWWNPRSEYAEKVKNQNTESSKLSAERTKWEGEKSAEESKRVLTTTATNQEKVTNKSLGNELGTLLRLPFFKTLPQKDAKGNRPEWQYDLGHAIKTELHTRLGADKAYQKTMQLLHKSKDTNKSQKMVDEHQKAVDRIAKDVVDSVTQKRYPNMFKGGSAVGRIATAAAKKAADSKASATSVATMKPVYVASRPKDLIRDRVVVGGKEYTSGDLEMLQIARGQGFVKNTNGTFKLVGWRK